MPKPVPEDKLKAIENILKAHSEGVSRSFIAEALGERVSQRTLQSRLRYLVGQGRAVAEGQGRAVKYRPANFAAVVVVASAESEFLSLSDEAKDIRQIVSQPLSKRKIVGYNRDFLDSYRANETAYLTDNERAILHETGRFQSAVSLLVHTRAKFLIACSAIFLGTQAVWKETHTRCWIRNG